mgnify:FL=1|jgi:hypothetical protein|tara:strand:- start:76 stop:792 length:717 start_codon:yes stop_codon:yes gene_type:complete
MSLRKIKPTGLLVAVALMLGALVSPLKADGLVFGVKGAGTILLTEAFETNADGAESYTLDHTEEALIPSLFVEYNLGEIGNVGDGWIVGLDYVPIKPEIGDETRTDRTDMEKGEIAAVSVTQKAKADLKFHTTLYVETPGFWGGFYGKAGGIMTLLQTEESLGTGAEYPDETILGAVAGVGFKRYMGNLLTKLEASYTAYETINVNARSSDANNTLGAGKITADPEALALSFSIGYAF